MRVIGVLAITIVVVGELLGRAYGLHHPVIYERTHYGYRVAPNQEIVRFGNRIHYNEQGLRNESLSNRPGAGVARILCVGDSVANGGAITDQQETIPAQLEEFLRVHWSNVEVLNGSAPGWAIGNELGWLHSNGIFNSNLVVLIISTHDLFQALAPASTVDNHPSFPSSQPLFAMQEILHRYLLPKIWPGGSAVDPGAAGVNISDELAQRNLENLLAIDQLVRGQDGRLVVAFLEQAGDSGRDALTMGAKRNLFAQLRERQIPVVTASTAVENFGRNALFRDQVHPNLNGNRLIAEAIAVRLLATASSRALSEN
jgi:hypothetical protein